MFFLTSVLLAAPLCALIALSIGTKEKVLANNAPPVHPENNVKLVLNLTREKTPEGFLEDLMEIARQNNTPSTQLVISHYSTPIKLTENLNEPQPTLPDPDFFDWNAWDLPSLCCTIFIVGCCVYGCYYYFTKSVESIEEAPIDIDTNINIFPTEAIEPELMLIDSPFPSKTSLSLKALKRAYEWILEQILFQLINWLTLLLPIFAAMLIGYFIFIYRVSRMTVPVLQIEIRFKLMDLKLQQKKLEQEKIELIKLHQYQLNHLIPSSLLPTELTYTNYLLRKNMTNWRLLEQQRRDYANLNLSLVELSLHRYLSDDLLQQAIRLRLSNGNRYFHFHNYAYEQGVRRFLNFISNFW